MLLDENKKNDLEVLVKTALTGEITDEYIELTKDTEMYKALKLDKIIEKQTSERTV